MRIRRVMCWVLVAGAVGCGVGEEDASGNASSRDGDFGNGGFAGTGTGSAGFGPVGGAGGVGGGAGDSDGPPVLPPEQEVLLDFELPQASERFVYAANPESGTVSIIDAETRNIQTLETGDRPTFLRTLAGTNDAIVLNIGSDDATIIRNPERGARTSTLPVVRGANAIGVAPDGKHAVVYFNAAYSAGDESGSYQDVTVLSLGVTDETEGDDTPEDSAVGMTVGFRPRDVFFAADGSKAFVVTEDGVSVLDFARIEERGPEIARLVSLGNDIDQTSLDVAVTPNGRYALARQPGASAVRLVDLESGEIASVDLEDVVAEDASDDDSDAGTANPAPVEVTDLDLSPTGAFAIAVLRNQSLVLELPVPGAFEDASEIEQHAIDGEIIGSATIAPDGNNVLLYTTAVPAERLTILDRTSDDAPRTLALRKAVKAVAVAPDSKTALVIHTKAEGDPNQPGIDEDLAIDRSHGYSAVQLGSGAVKLQKTQAAPGSFSVVPDGSAIFVLFRSDAIGLREVQRIDAQSFLVTPTQLGSPPVSIGSVPLTEDVFVSQEHPEGRITFIDWKTGERRTVTGFQLNSRIRD